MPSPNGTNYANAYIVRQRVARDWRGMAHDEWNGSLPKRGDRPDPAQMRETGQDDEPDDARERLMNLISQRLNDGNDQQVAELLGRFEGHGAVSEQRPGSGMSLDARVENLARFLRGKGMGDRDVRTACDLMRRAYGASGDDLGIGKSARFGGASTGSNFGGNLHGEVDQPDANPASRDACLEEELGIEPAKDYRNRKMDGRDSRRFGRDERMSFDYAYGMLPTWESMQPRRRRSARAMAMDDQVRAQSEATFNAMFPMAARIRNYI
jgi:hypothetical protein